MKTWMLLALLALTGCIDASNISCHDDRPNSITLSTLNGYSRRYCCETIGPSYGQNCTSRDGRLDFVLFGASVVEIRK